MAIVLDKLLYISMLNGLFAVKRLQNSRISLYSCTCVREWKKWKNRAFDNPSEFSFIVR